MYTADMTRYNKTVPGLAWLIDECGEAYNKILVSEFYFWMFTCVQNFKAYTSIYNSLNQTIISDLHH